MNATDRRAALERSKLYLVAPGEFPVDLLQSTIEAGVDMVKLRMKDAEAAEVLEIGGHFRSVCEPSGVPLIVNDRPDVALALGADGVHLGQEDLPPSIAREILGPDVLIGRSTHSTEDIEHVRSEHAEGFADYIAVGPVYETPTKPGRPAVGLDLLKEASAGVTFPWFAIGGINTTNIAGVVEVGVRRVVVVRAITESADPLGAVEALRRSLP
jgi:thiamine-phosphate pyrophosphorylase